MSPSTTSTAPPATQAPARNLKPYESVLETIGWTPLIRLTRITRGIRTPVYGKADFFNPGGSVKDRIGLPIIEQAEREGRLRPGGTIVEGTSGNTGVGLAIAAALKGYKCIFTMPDKMSQEKVRLLKAFGAEVIITPTAVAADHPDNYVMMAKRIAAETPNAILADQFYNQTNPEAHYATTGPELWEQTEGRITHFVAAAGTGGTITGVGRYLKERNPKIKIIAGDPQGSILAELWRSKGAHRPDGAPYKVEGIGQDKLPGTLDLSVVDDYRTVSDRDAFAMTRRLTREEGLFVGGSAGLITHVALQVSREVDDADWADAWKEHYVPQRIGRLVVVPSWQPDEPIGPDEVPIILDPGMAFGTGLHPTTRGCLALLQELAPMPSRVLDVGIGSGILAIAALRLGAMSVHGVDTDALHHGAGRLILAIIWAIHVATTV